MLIGSFFSEVGHELLEQLNRTHQLDHKDRAQFKIGKGWTDKDFDRVMLAVKSMDHRLQITPDVLEDIHRLLHPKRQFMLMLLGNPNLLEHEPFTDLLWAVFHLMEELSRRDGLPL